MNFALIVAGGNGNRMKSETPKQFLLLDDLPILMHSILPFSKAQADLKIVVVLPSSHQDYWMNLCYTYKFPIQHLVVEGGKTRFQSVKNGLDYIFGDPDYREEKSIIGIHDGARPLVSVNLINSLFDSASIHKAVVPVVDCVDSVRIINENGKNSILDRNRVKKIQTPQVFWGSILKNAYEVEESPQFTDDASVVENTRIPIFLTDGDPKNIKITSPLDLYVATTYLKETI